MTSLPCNPQVHGRPTTNQRWPAINRPKAQTYTLPKYRMGQKILTYLPYPGRANVQFPLNGYLLTYKIITINMNIHKIQSANTVHQNTIIKYAIIQTINHMQLIIMPSPCFAWNHKFIYIQYAIYRFIYISYTICISISTLNTQKYIAVPQTTAQHRQHDSARTHGWRRHGWRVTVHTRSSQHSSSVSNDSLAHRENCHTHKTQHTG